MTLAEISIKRPVFAWMLMAGLIVFGGIAFMRMGISQLPDVDYPVVSVNVRLEGAAPEVIETSIVDIIEDAVMTIQSVRSVTSESEDSEGTVTIEFDLNRDVDLAVQDVQAKVASVLQKLPKAITSPTIRKTNPEDQPIILLTLESGKYPLRDLMYYTNDRIKGQFSTVEGVGDTTLGGYRDPKSADLGGREFAAHSALAAESLAGRPCVETPPFSLLARRRRHGAASPCHSSPSDRRTYPHVSFGAVGTVGTMIHLWVTARLRVTGIHSGKRFPVYAIKNIK